MTPEQLRAYASRRWDLVEDEKTRWRAQRFSEAGPAASLAAASRLRERCWRLHGPPREISRAEDWAHHVALNQKLDRAQHVFARG